MKAVDSLLSNYLLEFIEKKSALPLYKSIYYGIRDGIENGVLSDGYFLPSSRRLAEQLSVSRNTVTNSYNELIAEGLVESVPRSGLRVSYNAQVVSINHSALTDNNAVVDSLQELPSGQLGASFLDMKHFPHRIWNYYSNHHTKKIAQCLKYLDNSAGYKPLRNLLATYLNISRGLRCTPSQIFITNGTSQSLYLISKVLGNHNNSVLLEDPGWNIPKNFFEVDGYSLHYAPVDDEGIAIDF